MRRPPEVPGRALVSPLIGGCLLIAYSDPRVL